MKGFFKFYLYVFDEDGMITKAELLTSWAPTAPFAAATEAFVLARGGYHGALNHTISENFQNSSLSVLFTEYDAVKLVSEVVTTWSLLDYVQQVGLFTLFFFSLVYVSNQPNRDVMLQGSVDFTGYVNSFFTGPERLHLSTGQYCVIVFPCIFILDLIALLFLKFRYGVWRQCLQYVLYRPIQLHRR